MAKWGEGDPRWIVEDRPDATNVNNWHWSEKNASGWSKEKLKGLLEGMKLEKEGLGEVTLKSITKCEGEATANNRKGKLIFFYEWALTIDWIAELNDPDAAEVKGTIEIPNLSEENDSHEVDVNVSLIVGGAAGDDVKTFLRKDGTKQIQNKLSEYITALREEYAQDLILPTNQSQATKSKTIISSSKSSDSSVSSTISPMSQMNLKKSDGCKLDLKELTMKQTFKCRADELYNVFTVPEMVTAFTRNSVKLDPSLGGAFELFGGNITGKFKEMEPNKLLVQQWRFKTWPEGHYSTVTLTFSQNEDSTQLSLKQTNIPNSDYERTKEGWNVYYWESIKRTFGFGASLM